MWGMKPAKGTRWVPALLIVGLLGGATREANAQQGTALDQFDPTPPGDRAFGVQSPDVRGKLRLRAGLGLDVAHDLLLLRAATGEIGAVVGDQVWARLLVALAIEDRFLVSLMVPLAIAQSGDDPTDPATGLVQRTPSGVELGDVRLGGRVRLFDLGDAFALAFGTQWWFPIGSSNSYVSDESFRVRPFLVVGGLVDRLSWSAELGVLVREGSRLPGAGRTPVGTAFTFGAAVGYLLDNARTLRVGPEIYGQTVLVEGGGFFEETSTNTELLGGVHWRPGGGDWEVGLGAGPGIGRGVGTPAYRLLANVAFVPEDVAEAMDRDGDGILDADDTCPDAAGVPTGDPRTHGCPPPADRDDDSILDADDACPDAPGVRTTTPATNGCPPASDADGDGILDAADACPDVAGVASDDPKQNGCPLPVDTDSDGDGILDAADACRDVAGVASDDPKQNGCPPQLAEISEGQIMIFHQIQFELDKAVIKPESTSILEAVAKILGEHPEIAGIEVQGYTDSTGARVRNTNLSLARATAVVKWLTDHGIAQGRLRPKGFGPDRPIGDNATEEGRRANRRVEFHIEGTPGTDPPRNAGGTP